MTARTFNALRITLFSLLVVWGLYTLLYYVGVSVHQSVLLDGPGRDAVTAACPEGGTLCQGFAGLLPFIRYTFTRTSPFFWYTLLSIVAFGCLAVAGYLKSGEWRIRFTLNPLGVLGLFVASLWLLFTVLSFGSNGDTPYVQLFEPLPQVYVSADAEGLAVLKENYDNLQERGCLSEVGMTNHGARVFHVSRLCMQQSFFTRVLPHVFLLLFLGFVMLVLGRALLRLLRIPQKHPAAELVFSAGIGSCALIVLLWIMALASVFTTLAGWALLVIIPAVLFRDSLYWLKAAYERKWSYEGMLWTGALIIGWLLITYLALNFLNVVRPFPIGWDDLGKYINQPRLLVSYGHFIPQLASFQWEYITSLGFLLFGYESVFGATFAMMINWMAGLMAVLTIYAFGHLYLGRHHGLLAALLYYCLPLVGHFSFADMKVDNAVFTMGALSILAVFLSLFPTAEEETDDAEQEERPSTVNLKWMMLAGILGGFAFAMKATSVMTLMAAGAIMFGAMIHWSAFAGAISLAWALYAYEGRFNLADIGGRVYGDPTALSRTVILGALLVLGLGLLGYSAWLWPKRFRTAGIAAGVFIGTFLLSIAPWILYNNVQFGNTIPRLLFTAPNNITPTFAVYGETPDGTPNVRSLPKELQVDPALCKGTAKEEELDRYWGYHSGWGHYLQLPWRSVMNLDSVGYYVTTFPALLLFPLLLLLPFVWIRQGRWLRWLIGGTFFMLVQWVFFANGIPWYGLGTFLGLVIGLEALVYRAPDVPNKVAASVLIVFSIMTAFAMRLWQFEQQQNLFEYPLGKVSADTMRERTIPHYDDIREEIERRIQQMPDRPYVYRIGTFIPYFIPRNLETLPVADHQLDWFNCLYQERDAKLLLRRLQALGFNSIIFDTNTHTIERDPNGSLHQKVQMFVDFVNTPDLGLQIVVNNPDNGIAFILLP